MRRITMATLGLLSAFLAAGTAPSWGQAPQPATPAPARTPPPSMPARPAQPDKSAPAAAAAPAAAPASAAGSRVDINSATEAQLDVLPGIGPVRSKAIIAGRPYADIKELGTKKILTAGVLAGIRSRIALANINTSSAADLERTLPGIGDVRSKAIVAGRPYAAPGDLVSKKVLTQALFDKIKDLVAY